MENHTQFGLVYIITNKDYCKQVYVGSTDQTYVAKRIYIHKNSKVKSYGNLFDTCGWQIKTIWAKANTRGETLRQKERFYYDEFIKKGFHITNQVRPWVSKEEARLYHNAQSLAYYHKHKSIKPNLKLSNLV